MLISTLHRTKLAWNLVFFIGDVWALFRWVVGGGVTMDLTLGPPEYAALIAAFSGGLVAVNYELIQSVRPAVKFGACASDIDACMTMSIKSMQVHAIGAIITKGASTSSRGFPPEDIAHFTALATRLDALRIPTPSTTAQGYSVEDWFRYLPVLLAHAQSKNIRAARKLIRDGSTPY